MGEFYTWLKSQNEVSLYDGLDDNIKDDELMFSEWIKSKPDHYVDTLNMFGAKLMHIFNVNGTGFYAKIVQSEIERRLEHKLLLNSD